MTLHTYFNLAATLEFSRCAAVANPHNVAYLMYCVCWFWGRFATQREQAPSPQVGVRLGVGC